MNEIFVQIILDRFVKCLESYRYILLQREKNRRFIWKHTLSNEQIKEFLSKLTIYDYWTSEPSEIFQDSYVHKFFKEMTFSNKAGITETVIVHVKFELIEASDLDEEDAERTVIISLHEAEQHAEYAFHKP